MHNPLVSILIPFKNTEDFIIDCLESIIKQTYTHWELLIVDDNSTDKTGDVARELIKLYGEDKIVLHER